MDTPHTQKLLHYLTKLYVSFLGGPGLTMFIDLNDSVFNGSNFFVVGSRSASPDLSFEAKASVKMTNTVYFKPGTLEHRRGDFLENGNHVPIGLMLINHDNHDFEQWSLTVTYSENFSSKTKNNVFATHQFLCLIVIFTFC